MDASTDTLETHFALGSLYRRRGEVERAIRVHQNLLARASLAPEHREQALLALAHDYLRAGVLDRAETLLQQVSEVPRLRVSALDALRGVYERQQEWQQALETLRRLRRAKAAPPVQVAAHYLCELSIAAAARGEPGEAARLLSLAEAECEPFARATLLRARLTQAGGDAVLGVQLLKQALHLQPLLLAEELGTLLHWTGATAGGAALGELVSQAEGQDPGTLKRLVFAAINAQVIEAPPLRAPLEQVLRGDATLNALWQADGGGDTLRVAREVGALLAHSEKYRCTECGFASRGFYWQCPACHAWDSLDGYAVVRLQ
jgi:lipopolysaccharide assembly protein B